MQIINRRIGETLIIGDDIRISVLCINYDEIKIGIEAPEEIPVQEEKVIKSVIENVA